jgi:hypothetical protein
MTSDHSFDEGPCGTYASKVGRPKAVCEDTSSASSFAERRRCKADFRPGPRLSALVVVTS